jgi:hypothetical protein
MAAREFFGGLFKSSSEATEELLLAPYKMTLDKQKFCKIKTQTLYKKILHRCYSRSEGAKDENKIASLFDSKERSGAQNGLISLIANAMAEKKEIGITYKEGVVGLATFEEKQSIIEEYKKTAKSSQGILVDFTKYELTDLVIAYMSIIYDILASMNTQVGLANSLQIKISSLRGTVSALGKDEPIAQAKSVNEALKAGRSVILDKNDAVETLTLNAESVEKAFNFVCSLLASDLGVSLSFITGVLTTGMSATGEADANADEYGFQDFFNSIFKPSCNKLYGWNLVFVTDDWRYTGTMLDKLIIVENSSILTNEQKTIYAQRAIPIGDKN